MDDCERFEQLVKSGYPCISIVTQEEYYTLELVRSVAKKLDLAVWIWSVSQGVRDGLGMLEDSLTISETEKPEAGLNNLAGSKEGTICVTLDIAQYIAGGGKPQRLVRDMIESFEKTNRTLVMIDSADKLPDVIKSCARPFEISFPDRKELEQIIVHTLRRIHKKTPIEIGITRSGLDIIIRNLRGLTRRQAEQVIADATTHNQRFDDNDINVIMASKRRMIQSGGLLEYIKTPLTLDEIGGMKNLKKWLQTRKNAFGDDAKEFGLDPPRGVLMLGVQGAGKSLCAKAIATAWHQPLLKMDPGALYACSFSFKVAKI